MPHFQIKLLEGKSEEQKQKLAAEVIKAAQNVIGFGEESYSVAIEEYSLNQWKTQIYPKEIMAKEKVLYKKPGYKF
ncbi:MAG: 4-oxalocrotonate tautomerase [Winogradskyella sp.]|uniref:Tautomerase family protein n=1 Tax=Winogradskyella poriferorum TaxID=307627 RepID=A0ABU7W641_9FLAO|nr:4-oxalocrotonate tautomerase [Winogradskyella sp.]|tara:strand:+ start:22393 stop:22620 length:228 start_codon:yes stop_codon:yes gene_type:complete